MLWLQRRPENAEAIRRLEQAWCRMDVLREKISHPHRYPDPDLFAPSARSQAWRGYAWAAAAVLVAGVAIFYGQSILKKSRAKTFSGPHTVTLEDGSIVELNTGARFTAEFSTARRDVHLLDGEAHFIVARNPARPFIVSTDNFEVRATGTAFDVKRQENGFSVVVTEGHVRLENAATNDEMSAVPARELAAGQMAIVATSAPNAPQRVTIRNLLPAEQDAMLGWQGLKLEFNEIPLRDVIAEFNRHNSRKLEVADDATGNIQIGGTFRADNLDAFVRLLDLGFGVTARIEGERVVLLRREK